MATIIANLKDGTAAYRAAVLSQRNHGRTKRHNQAEYFATAQEAEREASRLNSLLQSNNPVLFYSVGA